MRRSLFTLLEVMIAVVLLASIGSLVVFNIHKRVGKKKFHSQIERIEDRCRTTRKLSMAMQADWIATFKKEKGGWVFESECLETKLKKISPLHFQSDQILLDGKNVDRLEIQFFSSGLIIPDGKITFLQKEKNLSLEVFLNEL